VFFSFLGYSNHKSWEDQKGPSVKEKKKGLMKKEKRGKNVLCTGSGVPAGHPSRRVKVGKVKKCGINHSLGGACT